jgi:hypothetical protein
MERVLHWEWLCHRRHRLKCAKNKVIIDEHSGRIVIDSSFLMKQKAAKNIGKDSDLSFFY